MPLGNQSSFVFNLRMGMASRHTNLAKIALGAEHLRCSTRVQRCILSGHLRVVCMHPIRCRACFDWGHIAAHCHMVKFGSKSPPRGCVSDSGKSRTTSQPAPFGWFNSAAAGPSTSSTPIFPSFVEMARTLFPNCAWAARELVPINDIDTDKPITI